VPGEALWAQQGGMLCGGLGAAFERLPGPRRYGPARSGLRAEVTGRPQASATFGTGCSAALDAAPPVVGAVAAHAGAPKSGSAAARAPLSVGGDFGAQIDAEILRMGAGRIVVPAGLFSFSTTISIPRGISLQGGGDTRPSPQAEAPGVPFCATPATAARWWWAIPLGAASFGRPGSFRTSCS
jgi:hypothetical protein